MSKDELLDLLGSLYQTVSALLAQTERHTGEAAAHNAALLDILAAPEARPLSQAQEQLRAAADFYGAQARAHAP